MTPRAIVRMCEALAESHHQRDVHLDNRRRDFEMLASALDRLNGAGLTHEAVPFTNIDGTVIHLVRELD